MGLEIHHVASFIWQAMWPNIFAPSMWTLLGIVIAHIHHLRRQDNLLNPHTPGGLGDLMSEMKNQHEKTRKAYAGKEAGSVDQET